VLCLYNLLVTEWTLCLRVLEGADRKAVAAVLDAKSKPAALTRVRLSPAYGSQAALQLTAVMPDRTHDAVPRCASPLAPTAAGGRARSYAASIAVDSLTTRRAAMSRRHKIASISRALSFSRATS
jgi:hypothetical protein